LYINNNFKTNFEYLQNDVITTVFKTALMSAVLLSYSLIESSDLVVTRFPIMVSIIHLSLIGWPLLSVVSKT